MSVLADRTLEAHLNKSELLYLIDEEGYSGPIEKERQVLSKDGTVQPASLDLRVGRIFLPPDIRGFFNRTKAAWTRAAIPEVTEKESCSLEPGQTCVVVTEEILKIPDNYAGICFPPARLARNGVIMTNPGHVDPGYEGRLSFTLVNMSREKVSLKRGDSVATLLILTMTISARVPYNERHASQKRVSDFVYYYKIKKTTENLSQDFLDVREQAKSAAATQVGLYFAVFGIIVPLILVALASGIGGYAQFVANRLVFEGTGEPMKFLDRLERIEESVKRLEKSGGR